MGALTDDLSAMFTNLTSGQFSAAWQSFMTAMQEPIIGTVPFWMIAGGAALVYVFFFSGGKAHSRYQRGRRAAAAARSAYA
jgi:type VI protein secretion system component VasF